MIETTGTRPAVERMQPPDLLFDSSWRHSFRDRYDAEVVLRALGIRINVDRRPTHGELADGVRRSGLSVVWLDPA